MKTIKHYLSRKSMHSGLNGAALIILVGTLFLTFVRVLFPGFAPLIYVNSVFTHSVELLVAYLLISYIAFRLDVSKVSMSSNSGWLARIVLSTLLSVVIIHYFALDMHLVLDLLFAVGMYHVLNNILPMQASYVTQLLSIHLSHFKNEDYTYSSLVAVKMVGQAAVLIALVLLAVSPLIYLHKKNVDFQEEQRKRFVITSISPNVGVVAEEVVLKGFNFRWRDNETYIINSTYGPVVSHVWEDTKVSFIVPLHLKVGAMDIWLERSVEENSMKRIIKSNKVRFVLAPRETFFSGTEDSILMKVMKKIKRIFFL